MRYFVLILLFLIQNSINSQTKNIEFDPLHEIFCGSEGTEEIITFNLQPVGTIWDVDWSGVNTYLIDTDGSSDGGYFNAVYNLEPQDWEGFNYIASSEHPDYDQEDFGFGVYKMSVENHYFYLDWRDTRYGYYEYAIVHSADIYVKYIDSIDKVVLSQKYDFDESYTEEVTNGSYYSIWEMKGQTQYGSPVTTNVEDFWQNSLVLIKKNNHPRLVWGPHPNFNATHYKIYRSVDNSNFTLQATVKSTIHDWVDTDITFTEPADHLYYYVKGYSRNNGNYSSPTNTVNCYGSLPGIEKANNKSFANQEAVSFNL